MNTFLPYNDFYESAKVLDYKKLGKQRVETLQIYRALTRENYGWKNHPIVKMWKDYEYYLLLYGNIICEEWIKRGYKDTLLEKFYALLVCFPKLENNKPKWLGDEEFHLSHKSNLIRKYPEYYKKYWPDIPNDLPYKWIT